MLNILCDVYATTMVSRAYACETYNQCKPCLRVFVTGGRSIAGGKRYIQAMHNLIGSSLICFRMITLIVDLSPCPTYPR